MHKSKKEQLVIINQNSGYLMIDLANEKSRNYDVTLLTGKLIIRDENLNGTIKLKKIITYNRNNTLMRLITWIIGFIQIVIKIKLNYPSAKLIIVSNPPFNIFLPYFVKNKFSYLIYDLYPEALTEQGLLNAQNIIVKLWNKANYSCFSKANSVIVISNNMLNLVQKKYKIQNSKLVPLWSDNSAFQIQKMPKGNFFHTWNPDAKFIILYSGNIGLTQPLELLLEIAKKLIFRKEILFVIAGDGEKKEKLSSKAKQENLSNILFLNWQTPHNLINMLASSDLGVIPLSKSASNVSVPSKMYNYIAAGLPILGICNPDSEVFRLIEQEKIGKSFNEANIILAAEYILHLADNNDELTQLKEKVKVISEAFTRKNASLIAV